MFPGGGIATALRDSPPALRNTFLFNVTQTRRMLKLKVVNLKTDPQLMGALGAAEYARQKGLAKK